MVEYFFYLVIIVQTAIAALAYKPMLRAAQTWPAGIACFAVSYFSIFALAFVQLHRIHRERKEARAARTAAPAVKLLPAAGVMTPVIVTAPVVETVYQASEPVTALVPVRRQVALAEEPVRELDADTVAAAPESTAFGLTRVQLAVILLVFLAALKVFTWALANVVRR